MNLPIFINWLGGKRRLITQIDPYLPTKVERYFEPFLGGGAMFFYIKQKYNLKHSTISDINEDLIQAFKTVRDTPKELIEELNYLSNKDSEKFYYKLRDLFNSKKINGTKRSASFIYFTKSCFNAVYRVNQKGEFNVPYGYHKNREIFNAENILFASKLLQGTIIKTQDYNNILPYIKRKDLIYLDPCYDPIKRTSFVRYTPSKFSIEDRKKLSIFMHQLNSRGANVFLSNNNISEVKNIYKKENFRINYIESAKCVNVNPNGRGRISELLITNY